MAMTQQVKAELATIKVTKPCCRRSEVASMLRFADRIHIVSGRIVVEVEFDTGAVTLTLLKREALAKVAGVPADGTGSHRLILSSDTAPFTDPDGFAWEAASQQDEALPGESM